MVNGEWLINKLIGNCKRISTLEFPAAPRSRQAGEIQNSSRQMQDFTRDNTG